MPTWGEILQELQQLHKQIAQSVQPGQAPRAVSAFDVVRRKYLAQVAQRTRRPVVLYAAKWTQPTPGGIAPELVSISPEDLQGFMEVLHGLAGPAIDLIVHSPGGSAEATEAIVKYVRSRFSDVRVFVPHAAMSAATMLACSANVIVMGKHSFLGPIDPQFIVPTESGYAAVPAHAILEQFELAKQECLKQPALLPAWLPILRQYGPALIVQCKLARELSESFVAEWLSEYMFSGHADAKRRGLAIAKKLADHGNFKSHTRFIHRDRVKELGLLVEDLEVDQDLQDDVLSVFHAVTHTFNGTGSVKIIENHLGKAFLKIAQPQMVMMQPAGPFPAPQAPAAPPGPPQGQGAP